MGDHRLGDALDMVEDSLVEKAAASVGPRSTQTQTKLVEPLKSPNSDGSWPLLSHVQGHAEVKFLVDGFRFHDLDNAGRVSFRNFDAALTRLGFTLNHKIARSLFDRYAERDELNYFEFIASLVSRDPNIHGGAFLHDQVSHPVTCCNLLQLPAGIRHGDERRVHENGGIARAYRPASTSGRSRRTKGCRSR